MQILTYNFFHSLTERPWADKWHAVRANILSFQRDRCHERVTTCPFWFATRSCSRSQLSVDQSFINFPSLTGSLTGTKPACFFGGLRSRSTSCSRSLFCLASVLLPCSLCQLCVVRVLLISFPSLTGTKPACLFGGFRSRSTSYSSFSFCLASVLLPCSLCQLYVVRVLLISFPRINGSLTGTKPACLTG